MPIHGSSYFPCYRYDMILNTIIYSIIPLSIDIQIILIPFFFFFALFLHFVCLFTIEQAVLSNHQQYLHKYCAGEISSCHYQSHKVGPFMFGSSLALDVRTFSVISHKNT